MLEKLMAKRHIQNLDLSSVRAKLVEKQGWSPDQARRVEGDYKRFLYALAHKRKEDILSPPSQEVDDFWHQHILDTRKYREDCQAIFGHYVDHTPGLDREKQRQADECRRKVYQDNGIDSIDFPDTGDSSHHHDHGHWGSHSHDSHAYGDHGSGYDAGGHEGHSGHGDGGHSSDSSSTGDSGSSGDGGSGGDGGGCGGGGSCGGGGCGG